MQTNGIVMKIDSVGRVVIPKPIRDALDVDYGDAVEFSAEDGVAAIRPCRANERMANALAALRREVEAAPKLGCRADALAALADLEGKLKTA